jgi:hypothetical protein
MFIARLAGLFLLVALAVLVGAWVFTRDPRYLDWARRLLRFSVVFAMVLMALYVTERLLLVL